jgi:D-glycero-alpha-D-manno-heptose-7-phosphate kinase
MDNYLNDGVFTASAPLRIPIAGGGTDLPEYYQKHGGYWLSLSIDKTVTVVLHKNFEKIFFVHYKNSETCQKIEDIRHPIIREMLIDFEIDEALSIHSISELSGNSGLGSSSTFALCLSHALSKISNKFISNFPNYVYDFERNKLNEFVGKQDSWAAFSGGLKQYSVSKDGNMQVSNVCGHNQVIDICEHLLLVKAGNQRFANEILKNQAKNLNVDKTFEEKYHRTKDIAFEITELLKQSNINGFGDLVDKHWQNKLKTFNNAFDHEVFEVYNFLKNNSCVGAKLCGAGNSGYMLAVFNSASDVSEFIKKSKYTCVRVKPNFIGLR